MMWKVEDDEIKLEKRWSPLDRRKRTLKRG